MSVLAGSLWPGCVVLQRHLTVKTLSIAPKYEAQNPKFETIPNFQNPNFQNKNRRTGRKTVLNLGHLDFEFGVIT